MVNYTTKGNKSLSRDYGFPNRFGGETKMASEKNDRNQEISSNSEISKRNFRVMPAYTFKVGVISAAVWANVGADKRVFYNMTVNRRYKDGEEWKDSLSFGLNDIPKLELCLRKCYEWIAVTSKGLEE